MRANPYASPGREVAASERQAAGSLVGRAFGSAFLLCYPLPFVAAVGFWLADAMGAFSLPVPVVPLAVQGGSLIAAIVTTRTLARSMLCGPLFGPGLTFLYFAAVAAAWPLARLCSLLVTGGEAGS
ncbi:MAG TPA: hypothetical protein VGN57_05130 [Pirellulaceae bacterium]|jgi:hypothetical protein|nr:hypothetical protein [Pirellulaceae bacterium]